MNEELLTNEEMSALLPDTDAGEASVSRGVRAPRAVPYNFRRPDRLSKEQVRSLYLLHDLFAQNLSSNLPLFLRTICEADLISVEQQPYGEYLRTLPDPATVFTIAADNLRGVLAVELSASIAFPIIDRMLGGDGRAMAETRAATELEMKILDGFLTIVADNYREAWRPIVEFKTEITGRETRPQMLQIVPPNEVVVTVVYQMQIGEAKGTMSICLPVTMLESVIGKFTQSSYSSGKPTAPEAARALLETVSGVRLSIVAELDKTAASVADLMSITVGDVLRTNHRIDKPVRVCIGGSQKFAGKLAVAEGKIAVQVTGKHEQKSAPAHA